MEYFNWLLIPQYFMQYVFGGITLDQIYICMGVAGALYLVCLLLGGLGLWVMGTRQGIKHAWLAFLPFANTYYAGKVAGESALFGQRMKRSGLYAMLLEILYVALQILSLVISIILSNPAYYETRSVGESYTRQMVMENMPAHYRWMVAGLSWVPGVAMVAFLILVVFLCTVYNALFRKYYVRSPFLMTFLSVMLPVRGIVLFAVRRNEPVDYESYIRARVETIMGQNGAPTAQGGSGQSAEGNPFSDYADSPFSEFDSPSDVGAQPPSGGEGAADDTDGTKS